MGRAVFDYAFISKKYVGELRELGKNPKVIWGFKNGDLVKMLRRGKLKDFRVFGIGGFERDLGVGENYEKHWNVGNNCGLHGFVV